VSLIKVWTNIPELLDIPECIPQPAHKFLPKWWKDTPVYTKENLSFYEKLSDNFTVKKCPAFPEFLYQGIVIPMWCDSYLYSNKSEWKYKVPSSKFNWAIHKNNQFVDHIPSWAKDNIVATFKSTCPWYIKTPPGYSVYQLPLFYNFNQNYTVAPGSIQTDKHHQINQQVLFHTKKEEILIPRGEPFVWYIPYKREEFTYSIIGGGEEEKQDLKNSNIHIDTKFSNGYSGHTENVCPMKNRS
jgi:hypothetical protein